MQGISPGIVRGVTSPWMLVGGCRIARTMPIAVGPWPIGGINVYNWEDAETPGLAKGRITLPHVLSSKGRSPCEFLYNFLFKQLVRSKRMFFGTPPSSLDIVKKKRRELPIRLSKNSLQRLLSWKLGSASCSQRAASGAGNDLQSFGLLVSQGPVSLRGDKLITRISKELNSLGLGTSWFNAQGFGRSFCCFSCIATSCTWVFVRPHSCQVDEIDADVTDAWHERISLRLQCLSLLHHFHRSVEKHSKTWLTPSCC